MKLSSKKRAYINQHSGDKTPDEIAQDLKISVRHVKEILSEQKKTPELSKADLATGLIDKIALTLTVITATFTPLIHVNSLGDLTNLPKALFIQNCALILLLIWVVAAYNNKKITLVKNPLNLPLIGLLCWSLITVFFAINSFQAFHKWLLWASCGLIFISFSSSLINKQKREWIFTGIFLSGTIVAILGIFQYLAGLDWFRQLFPPAATFGNKNMAAQFIVIVFPLGVIFFIKCRSYGVLALTAVGTTLQTIFLFYNFTKASWLAVSFEIIAIGFFMILIKRKAGIKLLRGKTIVLIISAIVFLLMTQVTPDKFQAKKFDTVKKLEKIYSDPLKNIPIGSLTSRTRIWYNTFEMIKDNPWAGVGIDNWSISYPLYRMTAVEHIHKGHTPYQSHNDYIQLIAELGIIGFLFFVILSVQVIRLFFHTYKSETDNNIRLWLIGMAIALLGISINSFFSFPYQLPTAPLITAIYLAMLISFSAEQVPGKNIKTAPSQTITFSIPRCLGIAMIAMAVGLFLISFKNSANLLKADSFNLKMMGEISRKNWPEVLRYGQLSLQYNPEHWKTSFMIGEAFFKTGKHDEAKKAYQKFLRRFPFNLSAIYNLALVNSELGKKEEAFSGYQQCLQINPKYAKAHAAIGLFYGSKGDHEKAYRSFLKATEYDPKNSKYESNRGVSAYFLNKIDDAEQSFEKVVALEPSNLSNLLHLVDVYFKTEKYEKAADTLREVLQIDPENINAHIQLANVLYNNLHRKDEAVKHYTDIIIDNPNIPQAEAIRQILAVKIDH